MDAPDPRHARSLRWAKLEAAFYEAIALDPAPREALLAGIAREDPSLADELRRMIDGYLTTSAGFLESPDPAVATLVAGPRGAPAGTLPPGTRVGSCTIERPLGAGGMAVVYEATQERPHRRVAVKLIRPGIATPELVRRFELEAEILGRLDHPGIATIHEAGTADTGAGPQPYIVMEYVDGERLDEYARSRMLDRRARLELLAQICDAVQHAHQKGIIHRDLKPANILVTAEGEPKILDFGIARAAAGDQPLTIATAIGQIVGTLQYLSPEQAGGDVEGLDTRSDVYALGVIGYELLSGKMPYDLGECLLHEAVRIIREEEPTRLSALENTLRGDVETIIGKALAKEASRRYQSANDLADDIRRHLRNEPIAARPADLGYQLGRFARRHRTLVAAAAAIGLAIVAGGIASFVGMRRAQAAALMRARTLQFVDEGFFGVLDPSAWPSPSRRSTPFAPGIDETLPVSRMLGFARADLDSWFPQEPRVQAELHTMFGRASFGLRDLENARRHFSRALELEPGTDPEGARRRLTLRFLLARLEFAEGDDDTARTDLTAVAAEQSATLGATDIDTIRTRHLLATMDERDGEVAKAEAAYLELLGIARQAEHPDHAMISALLLSLGGLHWQANRLDESSADFNGVLTNEAARRSWRTMSAEYSLAIIADNQGQTEAAEQHYLNVLSFAETHLGARHDRTRTALHGLTNFYFHHENNERFEATLLKDIASTFAPDTTAVHNLGAFYRRLGRVDDALLWSRLAVILRRHIADRQPWELAVSLDSLAQALLLAGNPVAADPASAEAVQRWEERGLSLALQEATIYTTRGECLTQLGRLDEASAPLARAVAAAERSERTSSIRRALEALAALAHASHDATAEAHWRAKIEALP